MTPGTPPGILPAMSFQTRRMQRIGASLVLALLVGVLATGAVCAAYSHHGQLDPAHAARMGPACVLAHAEADAAGAPQPVPGLTVSQLILFPTGAQAIAWTKPIDHPPRA